MSFWGIGGLLAAGVSALVLSIFPAELGWRVGFGIGAVMVIMALFARRVLPESPRWLLRRGEAAMAHRVVEEITGTPQEPSTATTGATGFAPAPSASIGTLLRRAPRQAALGAILDFSEAAGYYGLFAFFAVLVTAAAGIPAADVPTYFIWGSVGALVGGFAVAAVMDLFPRAVTVTATYLLAAGSLVVLAAAAAAESPGGVLWAFVLANATATAAWVSAYPTFTELFPTPLRSTGVGFSVSVGSIGAAIASIGLVEVAAAFNLTAAFGLLAAFWVLGAAAMVFWARSGGPDGAKVPLERLEPDLQGRVP